MEKRKLVELGKSAKARYAKNPKLREIFVTEKGYLEHLTNAIYDFENDRSLVAKFRDFNSYFAFLDGQALGQYKPRIKMSRVTVGE